MAVNRKGQSISVPSLLDELSPPKSRTISSFSLLFPFPFSLFSPSSSPSFFSSSISLQQQNSHGSGSSTTSLQSQALRLQAKAAPLTILLPIYPDKPSRWRLSAKRHQFRYYSAVSSQPRRRYLLSSSTKMVPHQLQGSAAALHVRGA